MELPSRLGLLGVAVVMSVLAPPLAFPSEPENGYEHLDGLPILRVEFVRRNIFDTSDPETSSWPYRWANALHVVSKEPFLRSMILFAEGDPWDSTVADESARILRSLEFMNPVYIMARQEGDGVVVTVDTHDQWTLQVGAKFGLAGARKAWTVEFDEFNLLGWGRRVQVKYQSDHERNTWTFAFEDPNLFRSRWRTRLLFADSTDGKREEVLVGRAFYALETPRAWSGEYKHWEQVDHLYGDGESVVSGQRRRRMLDVWWGLRLPGNGDLVKRLKIGFHHDENIFEDWRIEEDDSPIQAPENHTISGPRAELEIIEDDYAVMTGFRSWSAQEDVILGPSAKMGLTVSLPAFGGDIPRYVFDAAWAYQHRIDNWLLLGNVWANGRNDDGHFGNVIGGFQVAASQLGRRGWQARLFWEDSHNLDRNLQLTLGADVGLRGWNPDTFDGTGRALLNVQWRSLVKEDFLHLFSLGVVLFVDAGKTWDPRVGFDTDGVRFDAGVGLLADLTHIGIANLLRFDVGYPDDNSGYTFTVTSQALF